MPTKNPTRLTRRVLALVAVVAMVGLGAACGGDDDSDASTVIETDRNTQTAADDEQPDSTVDPSDFLSDCAQAIGAVGQTAAGLSTPGTMDGGIDTLGELVPGDLQPQIDVLSGAIDEMQAAFDDAGAESGDPAAIQEVIEANDDVLDPARDALDEIETYFQEDCE